MHGIKRVKNLKEKILFEHKRHEFVFKWLEMNRFLPSSFSKFIYSPAGMHVSF